MQLIFDAKMPNMLKLVLLKISVVFEIFEKNVHGNKRNDKLRFINFFNVKLFAP